MGVLQAHAQDMYWYKDKLFHQSIIETFVILHNSRWSRKFSDLNGSDRVTPFSNVSENSINIAVNFLFVRRSHLGKFDVEVGY
jgi:hypothetical protein